MPTQPQSDLYQSYKSEYRNSGLYKSEYRSWHGMKQRCHNSANKGYPNYGGRGITVCPRWLGDDGFKHFLADVGPKPSSLHSIDRFPDNDGNYEPGNVRWATAAEQNQNRRGCVLDWDLVNEIRGRHEHGEPACSIARRMGLDPNTVGRVLRNERWVEPVT